MLFCRVNEKQKEVNFSICRDKFLTFLECNAIYFDILSFFLSVQLNLSVLLSLYTFERDCLNFFEIAWLGNVSDEKRNNNKKTVSILIIFELIQK